MNTSSPMRVTAGSNATSARRTGSSRACRSMRICPRRIVWQRTVPSSATTRQRQDSRKLSFRCCSSSVGGERHSMPATISTRHSLHFPCLPQDVGTCTPRRSAWSNSDGPASAGASTPLMESCTDMIYSCSSTTNQLPPPTHPAATRPPRARPVALLLVAPMPMGQIFVRVAHAAFHGHGVDAGRKPMRQRHVHLVVVVLGFDLRGNFLPIKDAVGRHSVHDLATSLRNRSTALEASAP